MAIQKEGYTCSKFDKEPINEGETGMVGPHSIIHFSSVANSNPWVKQPWFHNEDENGCWKVDMDAEGEQWI